jgi:RecA-family ATPase
MSGLPVSQAYRLADRPEEQRWLVTGLWSEQAVGIVGGEPKCCKSFLALDLAVAVASGTACLRRFPVARPGRVLLYAAEDALHVVRRRLEGICAAAGCDLKDLDVHVITAATLRIDQAADRERLEHTIAQLKPRLLVAQLADSRIGSPARVFRTRGHGTLLDAFALEIDFTQVTRISPIEVGPLSL